MILLPALLSLSLNAAPAAPVALKKDVELFEVGEQKSELKLYTDGKKHFIALSAWNKPFFYGDGQTFYRVRSPGGGASGTEQWSASLWDPRIDWSRFGAASFDFKDGKYTVNCQDRATAMTPVPDADAKAMLDKAVFRNFRWTRLPYKLHRDEKGTYYFVDIFRSEDRGGGEKRDFRLYVGQRGKMKPLVMTNVVSDSEGEIFATKSGDLRLVLDKKQMEAGEKPVMKWVEGKKEVKLIDVPVENNAPMIYGSLGVYDGEKLGTPCDDL